MMQVTRRFLEPKGVLSTYRYLFVHKLLPTIYQVSPIQPFYCSISDGYSYTKPQINNVRILQCSYSLQERWYLQRPFSSKPLQVNREQTSNPAEDEDRELVCRVIQKTEWSDKVETELNSLNIKLSNYIVVSVLRNLKQTPEIALKFFSWASTQTDFSHTDSTYNAVIKILGQKLCIDQFWSIVAQMANEGHKIWKITYRQIIRSFLHGNMVEDAVALFVLASDKYTPSSLDCRMILHQLSLSGSPNVDLVYKVLETFENGNGKFNKKTYDAVHRCLTMAGRFDEAIGVMKTMEEAGFLPDNDTFSQLVFGLCKAGNLDEACRVLDAMRELGCTPNLKTFHILIDEHCKAGNLDEACRVLDAMREFGCTPNLKTFNILIAEHCKAGEIDRLLGYFELVENGGSADHEVNSLAKALCSQNRTEDASRFLCNMISKKGLKVSRDTIKDVLQKLISAQRLQDAMKLLDMAKLGFSATEDSFYNLFARCGTVEGAVDFLNKVTRNVPRYLATESYHSMLNAFSEEGRKAEAQILLSKCPRHIQRNPDLLFQFGSVDIPIAPQHS